MKKFSAILLSYLPFLEVCMNALQKFLSKNSKYPKIKRLGTFVSNFWPFSTSEVRLCEYSFLTFEIFTMMIF
jgi:hypothetical protein